ncbi:hypothetical protein GKE82_04335 [Conexibacter sp. W3-3-2]|uniref:type II secretion system F family protein n=1 Tax=Conexibacter sp. W3-3-2 TaxID=2675227 RepID=UPI0012B97617|nr:type II secretion system F family protein [Conexibacter sp. W3-3-2]MTD43549.1 hypothetical protein [Conexibacter sp. W3-3-2]
MSLTVLCAAGAGALAVLALAELVGVVQAGGLGRLAARLTDPWRSAGRDGHVTDAERRRLGIVCGATIAAAAWLVLGIGPALVCAVAGPWTAGRLLRARRERWRIRAGEGVPLLARALADALAGGRSLRGAVLAAAQDGAVRGATGVEVRALARELELGRPTPVALEDWGARLRSPGTDVLVAAVLLQRESGGDLAGLLRDLAGDLEEGRRATADARTATAQARLTARLVAGLPVGAAALAELAAPGTITGMLAEPLSRLLAAGGVVLLVAALVVVGQLARVPR